jgi:hypothetical protein
VIVRGRPIFGIVVSVAGIMATLSPDARCRAARGPALQTQQAAGQITVVKQLGTIKAISGKTLTLAPDSGAEVTIGVQDNTKIVRVAPGQTDLKGAATIQAADLQVGDRIYVRGVFADDGKILAAAGIIVMKRADVDAKQQKDRDDWQKRGIGGLVESLDLAAGTVTIGVTATGGKKVVTVHTTKKTTLRRYGPDSIKFDEASPAPLEAIHVGDQLRARGTRSDDGSKFAAEEIVSGSFRNIAGTIVSIDSAANTFGVTDLLTKRTILVKISDQTQLRKLALEIAQRIGFGIKAAAAGASTGGGASAGASAGATSSGGSGQQAGGGSSRNFRPGAGARQVDFQQIVNRLPVAKLSDFQKGDALMIVSTAGASTGEVTAITVLGGVEPILAAAPTPSQAMTLSPWSLGGEPGGAGGDSNP